MKLLPVLKLTCVVCVVISRCAEEEFLPRHGVGSNVQSSESRAIKDGSIMRVPPRQDMLGIIRGGIEQP
jgi:hypothetical protein